MASNHRARKAPGSQQRDAADPLDQALTGEIQSVTQSVTGPENGVVGSGPESPTEGIPRGEGGSGGRIRTFDLADDSRRARLGAVARLSATGAAC
jgi:hypothetical protein